MEAVSAGWERCACRAARVNVPCSAMRVKCRRASIINKSYHDVLNNRLAGCEGGSYEEGEGGAEHAGLLAPLRIVRGGIDDDGGARRRHPAVAWSVARMGP